MLLNILPGFRELRAPLAAGYLWLLAGWLTLGESISLPNAAQDFLDELSGVGEAAALSFAAYIIGALLTDAFRPAWQRVQMRRQHRAVMRWMRSEAAKAERLARAGRGDVARSEVSSEGSRGEYVNLRPFPEAVLEVYARSTEPLTLRGMQTIVGLVFSGDAGERASIPRRLHPLYIAEQLDIARFRLLADEPELFNEVDRLRGEGQFRLAVAAPVAAIAVAMGLSEHIAGLAALIPIAVLAWQGLDRLEESGERVADALRAGKVSVPVLEELNSVRGGTHGPQDPPDHSLTAHLSGERQGGAE